MEKSIVFQPNQLGLSVRNENGLVINIDEDGPAFMAGVEKGWRIALIDHVPYDAKVLEERFSGSLEYKLTFVIEEDMAESVASHMQSGEKSRIKRTCGNFAKLTSSMPYMTQKASRQARDKMFSEEEKEV